MPFDFPLQLQPDWDPVFAPVFTAPSLFSPPPLSLYFFSCSRAGRSLESICMGSNSYNPAGQLLGCWIKLWQDIWSRSSSEAQLSREKQNRFCISVLLQIFPPHPPFLIHQWIVKLRSSFFTSLLTFSILLQVIHDANRINLKRWLFLKAVTSWNCGNWLTVYLLWVCSQHVYFQRRRWKCDSRFFSVLVLNPHLLPSTFQIAFDDMTHRCYMCSLFSDSSEGNYMWPFHMWWFMFCIKCCKLLAVKVRLKWSTASLEQKGLRGI